MLHNFHATVPGNEPSPTPHRWTYGCVRFEGYTDAGGRRSRAANG